jgi:hypothetical protein
MQISLQRPFKPKFNDFISWKSNDELDFFVGFFYKQKSGGLVIRGKS